MGNREKKSGDAKTEKFRLNLVDLALAEADGLLSFRTVMSESLYGDGGYYSSGRASVGRTGDFFTSVSVGSFFGSLLTRHILDIWQAQGRPGRFALIEQGANDGQLLCDLLRTLPDLDKDLAASVEPWIVEPLAHLQKAQSASLAEFQQVQWVENLSEFPADLPPGLFYSNELVDALPVDRVRRPPEGETSGWEEWCLCGEDMQFTWREIKDPVLLEEIASIEAYADLPAGYETELHLPARQWIADVAASQFQGDLLVIDYGFAADDYYHPSRTCGTLQAYRDHKSVEIKPSALGEIDLTAHVEFTGLVRAAEANGLELTGFANQSAFLTRLAAPWLLELEKTGVPIAPEQLRQFQTLTHPGMMGGKFFALGLRSSSIPEQAPGPSAFSDGSGRTGGDHLRRPPADS